jgi:hypothetical protein
MRGVTEAANLPAVIACRFIPALNESSRAHPLPSWKGVGAGSVALWDSADCLPFNPAPRLLPTSGGDANI